MLGLLILVFLRCTSAPCNAPLRTAVGYSAHHLQDTCCRSTDILDMGLMTARIPSTGDGHQSAFLLILNIQS